MVTGLSNSCMLFYNFNVGNREYLVNEPPTPNPLGGENVQIYTPAYNFTHITKDSLYFDVAYAPYNITYSDTLAIYYSLDCGINWNNIYYKGGMQLATTASNISATGDTLGFIPTSGQWRTDYIQLPTAVYGQPSVMFSFENRSYWGGQLYIDNINIPTGSTVGINNISSPGDDVMVYPNPNNGNFTLVYHSEQSEETLPIMNVYNVLGECIMMKTLHSSGGDNHINLSGQPNGVYFYRVIDQTGNVVGSGKLVIQK